MGRADQNLCHLLAGSDISRESCLDNVLQVLLPEKLYACMPEILSPKWSSAAVLEQRPRRLQMSGRCELLRQVCSVTVNLL